MKIAMRSLLTAGVALSTAAAAQSASYKWKHRPLYVFAPSLAREALAEQRGFVLAADSSFRDRDIVVVYVVGDAVSAVLGPSPADTAAALRTRYGVARDAFRVVLVGKDGGVKLSSNRPLTAAALASTIDAMPMRREEMRRRG